MHGVAVVALVALEGEKFDMKSFAQLAVTFFLWSLICSVLGFGGHAAAARAFRLSYIWVDCLKSVYVVLTLLFFHRFIFIKIMYTGTCLGQ